MKISPLSNFAYTSFCAKNERTRRADDIQRRAKETFPMISPTYVDSFYRSPNLGAKNPARAREISSDIQREIDCQRMRCKNLNKIMNNPSDIAYALELADIAKHRKGNCEECAKTTLATLYANGYYNSERVLLYYNCDFINKHTGETEYSEQVFLNHSFALTDMKKGNTHGKKDIVIDSWLGIADIKQDADKEFKNLYGTELDSCEAMFRKLFAIEKMQRGEPFSFDDYEMRTSFSYMPSVDFYNDENAKVKLGENVKERYKKISLPEKNKISPSTKVLRPIY